MSPTDEQRARQPGGGLSSISQIHADGQVVRYRQAMMPCCGHSGNVAMGQDVVELRHRPGGGKRGRPSEGPPSDPPASRRLDKVEVAQEDGRQVESFQPGQDPLELDGAPPGGHREVGGADHCRSRRQHHLAGQADTGFVGEMGSVPVPDRSLQPTRSRGGGEPEDVPLAHRHLGDNRHAEAGPWSVVAIGGRCDALRSGHKRLDQPAVAIADVDGERRREPPGRRPDCVGDQRRLIHASRSALEPVHLLQSEDVRAKRLGDLRQPPVVDTPIMEGLAVQGVEGHQAHHTWF